jgi:Spy/CpxP family protein refolding chaperone
LKNTIVNSNKLKRRFKLKRINCSAALVILVSFCLFANVSALAQQSQNNAQSGNRPPQGRGMNMDRMIERLDTELKLTEDQKKKIKAIYEENLKSDQQDQKTAKPNARRERLTQNREMTNKMEVIDQQIEKVLTADQVKKYKEMKKNRGGFSVDSRIERLDKELKLTADQKKKLRPIFEAEMEKFRKMREDAQDNQDREAMMASFRKIGEETNKEISKILTADQAKKYAEMQKQMQQQMQQRMQNRGQQQ